MVKKSKLSGKITGVSGETRVKTGVPGLDPLIEGGLIPGSTVLLSGGTGTGKTLFCGHFMLMGVMSGEKCVYISTEEPIDKIKMDWLRCGMNFSEYEKKKLMNFIEVNPLEIKELPRRLNYILDTHSPRRVVIDSTTMLSLSIENQFDLRKMFLQIISMLNKSEATSILIEEAQSMEKYSATGDVEYLTDGVIVLRYMEEMPEYKRHLLVRKMRRTGHSESRHPIKITDKGLLVTEVK